MTITSELARMPLVTGDGVTKSFDYDFRILADTDLKVIVIDSDGVETTKALGGDYSVTGVGDEAGGTIVFNTAPGATEQVLVLLDPPILQGVNFQADAYENAFDRLTLMMKRVLDIAGRAVRVSDGDTSDLSDLEMTLGNDKILGTNSTGKVTALTLADIPGLTSVTSPLTFTGGVLGLSSTAPQNKTDATSPPTTSHDSTQGYSYLSRWTGPTLDEVWVCVDDSVGAAIWVLSTGALASLDEVPDNSITADKLADGVIPVPRGKNLIINGNFDIWQRGTSQTLSGYGSDDRYSNDQTGTTKTHSRQAFTLGQTDVPNEPEYYSRTVVSSVAGASNYCFKSQKIESVRTLAGQTATLSFYAKADANKNIALEFHQHFGSGGSPSAGVTGINAQKISLTTSWQKFEITVNIPSVSGKTVGTNDNDYLRMLLWFDAGSDHDARTDTLGQQSGTFDIAQVQLEAGDVATDFDLRPYAYELSLCQRYYYEVEDGSAFGCQSVTSYMNWFFPVTMRTVPTVTMVASTYTSVTPKIDRIYIYRSGTYVVIGTGTNFDAEL